MQLLYILLSMAILTSVSFSQVKIDTLSRKEINRISINPGGTNIFITEKVPFSLGASYEYQYHRQFGAGLTVTGIFTDDFEYSIAVPIYYHPFQYFRLWVSPGMAYTSSISYSRDFPGIDEQGNPIDVPPEITKITGNFFIGLGFAYDLEVNSGDTRFGFVPYLVFDMINVETLYLGFGIRFELQFISIKKIQRTSIVK